MFQTKVVENLETHIVWSMTFFENSAVYQKMLKNFRAGQDADDNMAHVH